MRLNGWQRLWLVGTMCLGLWLVGSWPLQLAGPTTLLYRWELEKDFQNPQCRAYQTAPIGSLTQPPLGEPCSSIAFRRRFDDATTVPYRLEAYDRHGSAQWRESYLQALALGAVATGLLSAFVYLCGLVVGWIYQEFRRA
jgi:hypothetical protein